MKKIVALLLALVMCCCLFVGCDELKSDDSTSATTPYEADRFVFITCGDNSYTSETYILVDRETKVMYLFVEAYRKGGLTTMLNPDGTPMIYEGDLDDTKK